MIVFIRAATYAALFIGFMLLFLPARILTWSGITPPAVFGLLQLAGLVVGAAGGVLAVWCVGTFAFVGRGTPAPFDPPRLLVVQGPYRFVRNPMYLGAALYYGSVPLAGYAVLFLLAAHLFVVSYEEPTLRRTFGVEYEAYCRQVGRWW